MSRELSYNKNYICDNCGNVGATDFMGDYFCDNCIVSCEECESIFIKDLTINKEQKLCENCKNE